MLTPLVIAMPEPMAEALGLARRARSAGPTSSTWPATPQGWGAFGHPEWGPFRLGKTNPNFSTSGLVGADRPGLRGHGQDRRPVAGGPGVSPTSSTSPPASSRPSSTTATRRSRSSTTGTGPTSGARRSPTCRRWPSRRSRSSTTTAATPTACSTRARSPGRRGSRSSPSTRRRARSSPTTRTSCSTPSGSTTRGAKAARLFEDFVKQPENQQQVLDVRVPAGQPRRWPSATRSPPTTASTPTSRRRCSTCPTPPVHRRPARPLGGAAQAGPGDARARRVRLDGRPGRRRRPGGRTELDLAKQAAIDALDLFADDDEVGAARSSPPTSAGPRPTSTSTSSTTGRIGDQTRDAARARSRTSCPTNGTPLYAVAEASYERRPRRATTRPASTPSCCSPTARTTTATPTTTTTSSSEPAQPAARGQRGQASRPVRMFTDRATARDADLDVAAPHRRGQQRCGLQRPRPGDDQPGLHRGRLQLLGFGRNQGRPSFGLRPTGKAGSASHRLLRAPGPACIELPRPVLHASGGPRHDVAARDPAPGRGRRRHRRRPAVAGRRRRSAALAWAARVAVAVPRNADGATASTRSRSASRGAASWPTPWQAAAPVRRGRPRAPTPAPARPPAGDRRPVADGASRSAGASPGAASGLDRRPPAHRHRARRTTSWRSSWPSGPTSTVRQPGGPHRRGALEAQLASAAPHGRGDLRRPRPAAAARRPPRRVGRPGARAVSIRTGDAGDLTGLGRRRRRSSSGHGGAAPGARRGRLPGRRAGLPP